MNRRSFFELVAVLPFVRRVRPEVSPRLSQVEASALLLMRSGADEGALRFDLRECGYDHEAVFNRLRALKLWPPSLRECAP